MSGSGFNDSDMALKIEEYEKENFDLKQLINISRALSSTLNFHILIDSILLTCMTQMKLLSAAIFIKKEINSDVFAINRNFIGFELDDTEGLEIKYNSPFMHYLRENVKCHTFDELRRYFGGDADYTKLEQIKPDIIVPLYCKEEINGIILLADRMDNTRFTRREMDYLLDMALLAGNAIHNAELYEMATIDMMTGLKVHHYFQTAILEEIDHAMSHGHPLSLIMADIDHFKELNDTYGHSAGDAVLVRIAAVIKESIRAGDVAARYGGEEFAVILPNTDAQSAKNAAERLRSNVEREIFSFEDSSLRVTISVGVATFDPEKDVSKQTLINRADAALYRSKNEGRNRVIYI